MDQPRLERLLRLMVMEEHRTVILKKYASSHGNDIRAIAGWRHSPSLWQKTSGRFDIAEFYQEKRLCKEFEVTVVRG